MLHRIPGASQWDRPDFSCWRHEPSNSNQRIHCAPATCEQSRYHAKIISKHPRHSDLARLRRYRLKVRTEPSQGSNPGSSPGIATKTSQTFGTKLIPSLLTLNLPRNCTNFTARVY